MVKNPPADAGHTGDSVSIPGQGVGGGGNGNPLQYSCLGNPLDRGAWQATVHGVAKSRTRLSLAHSYTQLLGPCTEFQHLPFWWLGVQTPFPRPQTFFLF